MHANESVYIEIYRMRVCVRINFNITNLKVDSDL